MQEQRGADRKSETYADKLVSIVVPTFNEQDNIAPLVDAIDSSMPDGIRYEFVFVDDGSADDTPKIIRSIGSDRDDVRLVRFTRNFGHQAAIMAGIEAAAGDAVVTIDADLQHPPHFIAEMIDRWKEGALVVQMIRLNTHGVSFITRMLSGAFYRVINWVSYTPVRPNAAEFRLLDRVAVDQLIKMGDRDPFVRGYLGWLGFETKLIEFTADPRRAGKTSFSFGQKLGLAVRSLTRLSRLPLRLSLYLGVVVAIIALGLGIFSLVAAVNGETVPGWASIVIPVFFIGAVQLIVLGVIGEYLGILYDQSRELPTYVAYPEEKLSE
jgi:polyisoprenyl-phosphate glycosyltransferase